MNRHKQIWIYYFFLIMMCLPDNEKYPALLDRFITYSCYIGYMLAILVFFACKYFQYKELIPLLTWFSWTIVATILNGGLRSVVGVLAWNAPLICSAILAVYLIEHDQDYFFGRISWIFTALLVVQAFSLFTHCFGTHFQVYRYVPYYFFGIRVKINPIIPFAVFFGLLAYQPGKRGSALGFFISTACGLYFVVSLRVSTSLVGYAVLFAVFMYMKKAKNEHFVRNMTIFTLLFSAGFMFFYSGSSAIANWFFGDLLEEGITLNQRTGIWTQAINQMKGIHWIVGNGYSSGLTFAVNSRLETGAAHNQYLGILVNYGLIGLSLYVMMCVKQIKTVGMKELTFSARVFYSVFIAMILMQIPSSTYGRPYYYIFYVASLYLPSLENTYHSEYQY